MCEVEQERERDSSVQNIKSDSRDKRVTETAGGNGNTHCHIKSKKNTSMRTIITLIETEKRLNRSHIQHK